MYPPKAEFHEVDVEKLKRIGGAAFSWNIQYEHVWRARYEEAGLFPEEIEEARTLALQERAERRANISYHGDPAYGSWGPDAQSPVKDLIRAMMRGEVCPLRKAA
jgi:hypothetical protein